MNTPLLHRFVKCALSFVVLGSCALVRADDSTNAAHHIAPPAIIKSVFVADARTGKDPFFPNSTRRFESPEPAPTTTNSVPQSNTLLNQLTLKGISGTPGQMLALINSATVAVGELAEIRCGRQIVKIRCLEIRDHSVLIQLADAGETKELKLREGI